jgi:4-hydroxy-tetrahydrodipicolinate reductase
MGNKVYEACALSSEVTAVCGVDIKEDFSNPNYPVYANFSDVKEEVDVIIDFSSPLNFDRLTSFIEEKSIPSVLCATGYSEEQIARVNNLSQKVAIFRSANMSLGVNVITELVKIATLSLNGFDIEIVESHHNRKVDAPSGTAIMIADAIKSVAPEKYNVVGRDGIVGARNKNEIGIHSIRGGNIVGIHDTIFAGENETITISHSAADRSVFANGAVKAATYIKTKKSGLYNMSDMINGR